MDCEYNDWEWIPCPITCGKTVGHQTGHRDIKQQPENGGQPCDGPFVMQRECSDTTDTPCPGTFFILRIQVHLIKIDFQMTVDGLHGEIGQAALNPVVCALGRVTK